ncbi:MAG: YcxB family protein [Planctomycetes bacterium]|nr:YcxB family protein [Planctomycetota bacterium]
MTDGGGAPLSIGFHTLPEDWVAFNTWHLAHSGAVRRMRIVHWVVVYLILVAVIVGALIIEAWVLAPAGAVLALLLALSLRRNSRRQAVALAESMYGESEAGYGLGRQTLTIDGDWLALEGESWSQRVHLRWVRAIESTDTHHFIYYGPLHAYYVPKQRLTSGDLEAFIEELRARSQGVRAGEPSEPRVNHPRP